ncbi:MAG: hypothetical protein ABEJ88_04070 [Halobacterium sp.]
MNVRPQLVAGLVPLLALVPVALYAVGQSVLAVTALVNVVLVAGCLWYMFSPTDQPHHGVAH